MIFRPFYYFDRGCAAYLFGCGTLSRCAVVDPRSDDVDSYVSFSAERNMRITHVIDTHVHADHRSGAPELARRLDVPYCLHESADFSGPFTRLKHGDDIELGNTRVKIIHTPGHSPDSICLLVTDLKRGTDPWFVLTGDTLFVGAVGRPDLPGHARANATELFASIHEKLLTLPDELEVYPGHFSGSVCGVGLSGKPMSTIGFERRWNPMLSRDKQSFIDALASVPPKPTDMERIMAFNHGRSEANASA
jgi:glyoxylase-like metal-dependent hydrolase (beta-lactamase superfamily II)